MDLLALRAKIAEKTVVPSIRVKVGKLKPIIKDGVLIFEEIEPIKEIPMNEIPGILDELIDLNLQRYLIRQSKPKRNLLKETLNGIKNHPRLI